MTTPEMEFDAIVLGGGAAGLMCAIEAGKRGRRVLLVEHNESVGKKIRISGGGRCNFTNLHVEPSRYISENPRFCYSALSRYTPADFLAFVERHGIAYHEKKLGQLFCDGSAQQIIDALVSDCAANGVSMLLSCSVRGVERGTDYAVTTSHGTLRAPALVVATGGLSITHLGATDLAFRIAAQFDVPVIPCAPALVPFTFGEADAAWLGDLSGVSFDAAAACGKTRFEESVLITHRGLSGPAILQVSSYWASGAAVTLDLFPGRNAEAMFLAAKRGAPAQAPKALLAGQLPQRLAQRLCERHRWAKPLGETPDADLRKLAAAMSRWPITPGGTEGYKKAEVTRGGIDTRALSPKTMEAKSVPGLYFIGEAVDVTGWLGGYNFQWAWASGAAAGRAL